MRPWPIITSTGLGTSALSISQGRWGEKNIKTMKGIIIVKDPGIAGFLQKTLPDWIIAVSETAQKEVEFFSLPA